MTGLTKLERRVLKESRRRPGGHRPSLRGVARRVGGICHETVRRILDRLGEPVQSPEEAAQARRVYPRPWSCVICKSKSEAWSWNEFRRETCSKKCKDDLRRSRIKRAG